MFSKFNKNWLLVAGVLALSSTLGGCSSKDDELERFIEETKKEPGGSVKALPELKPYETYAYNASSLRSPFVASAPVRNDVANAIRPDSKRPR